MANDDRRHEGIGYRGLTNYRAPTESEIQAGISASMRDVIRRESGSVHSPSSPGAAPAASTDTGRVRGTMGAENGWQEPKALGLPTGVDLIDRLVQTLLPHGKKCGAK
jgi:hypothetical protein